MQSHFLEECEGGWRRVGVGDARVGFLISHENPSGARKFLRCTKRHSRLLSPNCSRTRGESGDCFGRRKGGAFSCIEKTFVSACRFRVRRPGVSSRDDAWRADGAGSVSLPGRVCEAKRRKASPAGGFRVENKKTGFPARVLPSRPRRAFSCGGNFPKGENRSWRSNTAWCPSKTASRNSR